MLHHPRDAGVPPVVLYEWPHHHAGHGADGINVLFGDGHAEFLPMDQARLILDFLATGVPHAVRRGPGKIFPARPAP